MKTLSSALALLLLFAPYAFAQTIHSVDALGGGDFLDIQSAVDAASPSDVVLVKAGTYAGFELDGMSLVVTAEANSIVTITGPVNVINLPIESEVVLEGLTLRPSQSPLVTSALSIADCAGHVLVQNIDAAIPAMTLALFAPLSVKNSDAVAIVDSRVDGSNNLPTQFIGAIVGDNSNLFLHRVTSLGFRGFDGTVMSIFGNPGGSALDLRGGSAFLVDVDFRGGAGGAGNTFGIPGNGGAGGSAIRLLSAPGGDPSLVLYDSLIVGGAGGVGIARAIDGVPGVPIDVAAGTVDQPAVFARTLEAAPVVRDGETVSLVFRGQPADLTWHVIGFDSNSTAVYLPGFQGAFHIGGAQVIIQFRGRLNADGNKTLNFNLQPTGLDYLAVYEQAFMFNPIEGFVASNPVFVAFFGSQVP